MPLLWIFGVVIAVVAVRELARWLVHGGPLRFRAIFDLTAPGSLRRRTLAILAGLAAMYLAVAALAFTYGQLYGLPTGIRRYAVGEVLAGSAAEGKLERGDRIDAFDGEPLFVSRVPSLSDRVNAKGGLPFDLQVMRDGSPHVIRIAPTRADDESGQVWRIGMRIVVDEERVRTGAVGFALGFPFAHARGVARELAASIGGDAEVGGVVRLTDEFRTQFQPAGQRVVTGALQLSAHALLLFALLDLIRLAIVIRDRLRR